MKWMKRIREFEDLVVWQESQNLAVEVYTITKLFPKDELYGITSQIRRSSSSVSANIAEGFGRSSRKELLYFYSVANGSLLETKNFLYLAEKLGYIDKTTMQQLLPRVISCQRLISASKRSLLHV